MHPQLLIALFQVPVPPFGAASPGVDWMYQFTNNITALTTANGGVLTNFGLTLLSTIAIFMLVSMVIDYSTATMTFSLNPTPLEAGVIVKFLLRLGICSLLETYWANPVPGSGLSLNHLFSAISQQIVTALDQNSMATLTNLLSDVASKTGQPSALSMSEVLIYMFVEGVMVVATAILFVVNASSFIFYAVGALFGPLFIPLLMTNSFRGKFYSFVEVLLSFAMIRAVSAAFIFVWSGFMTTFISQTFNGDYSITTWTANFIPACMVFVAFVVNMLFIPTITQAIFGGGAGGVGAATGLVTRIASYSVSRGLAK